jgi:hypothetical protein
VVCCLRSDYVAVMFLRCIVVDVSVIFPTTKSDGAFCGADAA